MQTSTEHPKVDGDLWRQNDKDRLIWSGRSVAMETSALLQYATSPNPYRKHLSWGCQGSCCQGSILEPEEQNVLAAEVSTLKSLLCLLSVICPSIVLRVHPYGGTKDSGQFVHNPKPMTLWFILVITGPLLSRIPFCMTFMIWTICPMFTILMSLSHQQQIQM